MAMSVNQVLPVVAVQGVSGDVALQPGSVVSARVVQVLPDNQVRIAIGNVTLEAQSELLLQIGQTLQLSVSQTADGIRLALVPPSGASQQGAVSGGASPALPALDALFDTVTLAPDAPVTAAATNATPRIVLTAPEAQAVTTAAQIAVTQQAGLSALFADLGVATTLQNLPQPLRQAAAQLLAQRPVLDTSVTGAEIKQAFQQSGLFLEASLASGTAAPSSTLPDLKAALIVFRQLLSSSLAALPETTGAALLSPPIPAALPETPVTTPAPAATPAPEAAVAPAVLRQANSATVETPAEPPVFVQNIAEPALPVSPVAANLHVATTATAALSLLQELQQGSHAPGAFQMADSADALLPNLLRPAKPQSQAHIDGATVRTSIPPPPLRGGLPSAQAVALSTLQLDAPLASTVKHLLADTDAAIARQTLMQVASLPDRADIATARLDPTAPRWNFEIPFATPHGTAVAQFEIARDGGNDHEAEAAKRVWRARFSLDVEPAGPVHALISLTGDKTSVRMWAERPATAQQLRAGAAQLGQALVRADLTPGDIVIREGAPTQPAPAPAGHFLDRAL